MVSAKYALQLQFIHRQVVPVVGLAVLLVDGFLESPLDRVLTNLLQRVISNLLYRITQMACTSGIE